MSVRRFLSRTLCLPDWLIHYEKDWLKPDLIAGLICAAVVIPKSMAYATIAGLPVQVGLYTAFLPMIVYSLLGSSRVLSVSTSTTIAILTGSALSGLVSNESSDLLMRGLATLTLLVGIILLLAAFFRLGFIANFISEPVLVGFKAGIALVILLDQIPKLLGVHITKTGFVRDVMSILKALPDASAIAIAIGLAMILGLVAMEKFSPRAPAPLIAVAAGIILVRFFHLDGRGLAIVGHFPEGLPAPFVPNLDLVSELWPAAMGIALMSFTETIAAGRVFVKKQDPRLMPNRELLATGLGNTISAFFQAMPSGGGTTQTAVNRLAGARTQLSELATAAMALLVMLLLAPVIGLMPQATLAAIVIVYSVGLIQPEDFRAILKIRRMEFLWALTAFAGVLVLGTLQGILVAVVVSLVALAHQAADPPVYVLGRKPGTNVFRPRSTEHPEDETFPGLLILRPEGRIFFVNAERAGEKMRFFVEESSPKVVMLDLSGVPDLEYTALKMLVQAEKRLSSAGVSIWLTGLTPKVLSVVNRSSLGKVLGRERMHFTLELAVEKYLDSLTGDRSL